MDAKICRSKYDWEQDIHIVSKYLHEMAYYYNYSQSSGFCGDLNRRVAGWTEKEIDRLKDT